MIVLAKLVSQEFVVGKATDNVLTNVALVTFQQSVTAQSSIKLVPYMHPLTADLCKIMPIDRVMCSVPAPEQLTIAYLNIIKEILENSQEKSNDDNEQNGISGGNTQETASIEGEDVISE